jgi:hypothetical protein
MVSNNPATPTLHDIAVISGQRRDDTDEHLMQCTYEEGTPENLRLLKAVLQQYFNRVMNNQLTAQ